MVYGFSFCGVHINDIGLEYAPEIEDTYVFGESKGNVHEETFDGQDGGYFYGVSKEPKEFVLKCIFEEKHINKGIMSKVDYVFKHGKSGKLIFDTRPWCYYYATVTEVDPSEMTNYLNGVIKITMKAYYPFARSDLFVVDRKQKHYKKIIENTAILEAPAQMPKTSFAEDIEAAQEHKLTTVNPFILYNPGNERAPLSFEIAGDVGLGVDIKNETNGQECRIVVMTAAKFGDDYLYVDGINGKVLKIGQNSKQLAFLYHNKGFIELEPGYPLLRNISAETGASENILRIKRKIFDASNELSKEMARDKYVGRYIWYNNEWVKITDLGNEDNTFILAKNVAAGSILNTCIAKMNIITVTPVDNMSLTRLNFLYKPTFA